MNKTLAVKLSKHGEITIVEFHGRIDEFAAATLKQTGQALAGHCAFDLSGITAINSCGVAEWLNFLARYCEPLRLEMHRCSLAFIASLSLIGQLRGNARVVTVMVEFLCGNSHYTQWPIAVEQVPTMATLTTECRQCGATASCAAEIDEYAVFTEP